MNYCEEYPELMRWVNLCEYSIQDISLVAVGTLFWVICYFAVIRSAWKTKFIEMPMFVAAGNIGWEFIWSFFFITNMGEAFLWGYRIWFIMDLFIFYYMFRYGAKQTNLPWLQKNWKLCFAGVTAFFIAFFYYFAEGGYDTPIGATSAYFLSVGISTLYITLFLAKRKEYVFSWTAAWSRAVGDIIMTIFVLSYYDFPRIGIVAVMGAYVATLDIAYVVLVYRWRKQQKLAAA